MSFLLFRISSKVTRNCLSNDSNIAKLHQPRNKIILNENSASNLETSRLIKK